MINMRAAFRSLISCNTWHSLPIHHSQAVRALAVAAKPKVDLKTPLEAFPLIKTKAKCKFDESVDIALKLNVDPRKSDQAMRGLAVLPHGTGKKMKVAVFATGPAAEEALANGATIVGGDDLVEKIKGGMLDFDRCIATPAAMPLATKVARILGPRGLMPNAKLGTVTDKVGEMIKKLTSGVPFKTDKGGIVHANVGKVSFTEAQLADNVKALVESVYAARPRGIKDPFVISASISSTMGPSFRILPVTLTGGQAGATSATAQTSTWTYKEPEEPTGDISKIPSRKLRRYMEAKRALAGSSAAPAKK